MASFEQLKKIAKRIGIVGGIGTVFAINTIPYIIHNKISKMKHYEEAINLLNNHPEAIKYLGEPIKTGRLRIDKKEYHENNGTTIYLEVPVKGSKTSGKLLYNYIYKSNSNESKLALLALILDNYKDYTLLIKKID